MTLEQTVARVGGIAAWAELRAHHSAREIRKALADGRLLKVARGRFVTKHLSEDLGRAIAVTGVLSHLSAALHHGWKVKTTPDSTHVTLPRKRGHLTKDPEGVLLHRADLTNNERSNRVTSPLTTVMDCARSLPFDEALAVADQSLRSRKVKKSELMVAANAARGPGARAVRRVAHCADGRAANPLESVLRALTIEEGFVMVPQLQVADPGLFAIADLGSVELQLVLEADGYESHGTRAGLRKDCRRHTEFTVFGWDSMRYAYEHIMFEQAWVRWTLRAWRDVKEGRIPENPPTTAAWAA